MTLTRRAINRIAARRRAEAVRLIRTEHPDLWGDAYRRASEIYTHDTDDTDDDGAAAAAAEWLEGRDGTPPNGP